MNPPQPSLPSKPSGLKSPGERAKGPWGRLESFPIFLECPADHLEKFPFLDRPVKPCWSVAAAEVSSVLSRLEKCGLPPDFLATLKKPASQIASGENVLFFPPEEGVMNLTPEVRAAVYRELSRFPQNLDIIGPALIPSEEFDAWFRNSSLRPELVELIRKLSYPRGEALAFSDHSILSKFITHREEAKLAARVLTRTPTLVLKLIIDQKSKIKEIAQYWSTAEARRVMPNPEPFLKSLQESADTCSLDVVHLLPPLPRKLLYTYVDPASFSDGEVPDCHWSSLNFFKHTEEPYFLHSCFATTAVLERYQPVKPPFRFGDLLIFLDTSGNAFHSCVYIADDILFTKNGRNILSPWVFQSLPFVKMAFSYHNFGRLAGYRAKST